MNLQSLLILFANSTVDTHKRDIMLYYKQNEEVNDYYRHFQSRTEFARFCAIGLHIFLITVTEAVFNIDRAVIIFVLTLRLLATNSTEFLAIFHSILFPWCVTANFMFGIHTFTFSFRFLVFTFSFTTKVTKFTAILSHKSRFVIWAGWFSETGTIFMQVFARSTILDVSSF